jgi:hypothetical protein
MNTHPGPVVHLSDNPLDSNKVRVCSSITQKLTDWSLISVISRL